MSSTPQLETATLGGGCFWCLEAVFDELQGVHRVESGYAGGQVANPTYRQVGEGLTGHAEVIQVLFDPATLPYRDLLEIFFSAHDPTTLNRQGADVGPQYRSVILTHGPAQQQTAAEVIAALNGGGYWPNPIVTEVAPYQAFYRADDGHQDYYRRNSHQPYCRAVIAPKLAKLRQKYAARLKA